MGAGQEVTLLGRAVPSLWEDLMASCQSQTRVTSSSGTVDPYQNTGQSQQNLMDTPALTDCHPDTAGNVLIENLSPFPGLTASICAPEAQPLCPVREATQETGSQRTMPALGLRLQSWACNLRQQDLSRDFLTWDFCF